MIAIRRARQSPCAVAGWVLGLYAGNPPSLPLGACTQRPALGYQLAARYAWERR